MTTEFYAPTHIFFGNESVENIGEILSVYKAKKVLIVFGSNSVKKNGLLKKVEKHIRENKIQIVEYGNVVANPRVSHVRNGITIGKNEEIDFILAVGGGSVIDTAKAIGYGLSGDADVWDYYVGKSKLQGCYPIGVILTNAASGSEMSNTAVLTNDEVVPPMKRGCPSDAVKPKFAILDPSLTFTLPAYQTSCGITDMMSHTLERYFCGGSSLELTDSLSIALLKTVIKNGRVVQSKPFDYQAKASLMWASSVSHNGLMEIGNSSKGDWACHQIEHDLSALFDVAHGAGLAAIWASWARYVYKEDALRFATLGKELFDIECKDVNEAALETIDNFEKYFKEIGMPVNLIELGLNLDDEIIKQVALKTTNESNRTIGRFKVLDTEDVYNILIMANNAAE